MLVIYTLEGWFRDHDNMITLALLIKLPQHSLLPTKTSSQYDYPGAPVLSSVASKFARVGWGGSDMYSRASFSSTDKYLPTGIELGKNLNF